MSCTRGCCATPQEHWRSVAVAAQATPTRRSEVARIETTEKAWDKDLDAYQRLRRDGVQPSSNLGCADLERSADHRWDIEAKPRQDGET